MDLRILAEIHDWTEEVEQPFEAFEGFKDVYQGIRAQLLVVLGGHLDADLKILADVRSQHGFEAFQGILHWKGSKVVDQPL